MGTRAVIETRRDRKALVADAGYRPLSIVSVLAGVLTAYGAFALLAGVAVGILRAVNAEVDLASQWRDLGVAGGLVVAGLLLLAYLFGGYVAGRMARRSGTLHGVVVFLVGALLAAGAAWLARQLGGADVSADVAADVSPGKLRDLGLPTTAAEWRDVATVAGVASLAAMLVGSLLGGVLGERWHDKLLRRALDPSVGAEARAHREAERRAAEAEERRTTSYQRVRATSPSRTRRVDGDGVDDRDRIRTMTDARVVEPAGVGGPVPVSLDKPDRSNRTSFWRPRRHDQRDHDERAETASATGRRTVP